MNETLGSLAAMLSAYPLATASTGILLLGWIGMLHPGWRRWVTQYFSHPISPQGQYLDGFDTLRGIAAAYIALGHFWWFTHPLFHSSQIAIQPLGYGSKAVPMFVVLSGFLIYRSVLPIDGIQRLRQYIRRRFFRIYPVYFLSIVLGVLFVQNVSSQPSIDQFSFFVSELFMFRVFDFPMFSNPVTWSLYVEITFYAFLPLFVLFFGKDRILWPSVIVLVALIIGDQGPIREFYLWKYFFFGLLASELTMRYAHLLRGGVSVAILIVGLVGFLLDIQGPAYDWATAIGLVDHNPAEMTLGLGISFGLVCLALPHVPLAGRILNFFPLRFIGVVSYSLFIIHPFYILANFPLLDFRTAGSPEMFAYFQSLPPMPAWYMPVIFAPGVLLWSGIAFLLVERPFLLYARRVNKAESARLETAKAESRERTAGSKQTAQQTAQITG